MNKGQIYFNAQKKQIFQGQRIQALALILSDQSEFGFILIIQMSTDKTNLLNYLPPEQRQRVLLLIQRLQEETQAKNKFQSLYNQSKNEFNDLLLKYNKLKDENAYLKQQMHNSFSMISQVRANFQANKEKLSNKKERNDEWSDDSQSAEDEQNQPNTSNQHVLNIHPPKPNQKSSLDKYRPQQLSAEKNASVLNISSSFLNQTNLSTTSKSKELQDLRREVKALQLQKIKEEEKAKQLTQKHKLVDEIKNRYKSHQGESSSKIKQRSVEKIDITGAFENDQQEEKVKQSTKKPKTHVATQPKPQKKQPVKPIFTHPQNFQAKEKSSQMKKRSHIEEDYGDVLDLINDYNL